jgi:hypothetical protein
MGHIVVCEAAFNWGGEIVCPYLCSYFYPHEQRRASTLLGYWHGSQRESRLSHEASEYIANSGCKSTASVCGELLQ